VTTKCPQCRSREIRQTDKFDGTNIDPDEVVHDFECDNCGCLFNIYFAPVETKVFERGTLLDPEPEPARKGSGKNFRVQKLHNPKEQVGMPNTHKWAVMSDDGFYDSYRTKAEAQSVVASFEN
jgi:hypothetical protein